MKVICTIDAHTARFAEPDTRTITNYGRLVRAVYRVRGPSISSQSHVCRIRDDNYSTSGAVFSLSNVSTRCVRSEVKTGEENV
jgi:hypothetical protein